MKKIIVVSILLLIACNAYAQWSEEELKPYRLKAERTAQEYVQSKIADGKLDKEYDATKIEFMIDTLRIENVINFMNEDERYTTYDMHCANIFLDQEYDKLLNKYYKMLRSILPEGQKATLLASQRSWLKYRDSERLLNSELIGAKSGTMWGVVSGSMSAGIVKSRVLDLFNLLQNIQL